MVAYVFNNIIGQRVSFAPAADTLSFGNLDPRQVSFTVSGETLLVTTPSGTVTLDATPQYPDTTLGIITTTNFLFSGLGRVVVGDLTIDDTLDGDANTLDFTTHIELVSARSANNLIYGLGGDDTIILTNSAADHLIFGGAGGDTITSGNGDSTLYGGSSIADTADGDDSFIVGSGTNTIYGNAGADAVTFSSVTGAGNLLRFWGGTGADSLTADGSAGNFDINAGPDGDVITLTNATSTNTVYGGAGGDTIDLSGSTGNNTVYGGTSFADSTDLADAITLGSGSDLLYANAGADTVVDSTRSGQTSRIYLGSGADTLTAATASGNLAIYGGTDGDAIDLTGHTGNAIIFGGGSLADSTDGADTITTGAAAAVLIYANSGNDSITVTPGLGQSASIYAGSGNDTISAMPSGGSATLLLRGNSGDDHFALNFSSGTSTAQLLDYGTGDNSMELTLSGGAGAANLTVERNAGQTVLRNGASEQIILGGFTGNFDSTNFVLSNGSVLLTNSDATAATLTGTDNNDQLIAGSNGDTLVAGAGNDILTGGSGADRFSFVTANFDQNDTVTGGAGLDTLLLTTPGTAITDSFFANKTGLEILKLDSGDFGTAGITLGTNSGTAGIFAVDAASATDVTANLSASSRGILYIGATDTDSVLGSGFSDAIDGKAGNDTITGGLGGDILQGGDGEDVFVYTTGAIEGGDTIRDFDFGTDGTTVDSLQFTAAAGFNLGNLDTIVDGAIINTVTSAGANGTELVILKTIGVATADITATLDIINANVADNRGALNVFFDTTRGQAFLYYDINGSASGGHVQMIVFENITTLAGLDAVDFNDFSFV